MNLVFAIAIGAVAAAGLWLVLTRDLLRCAVGVALLGSAASLAVFMAGRIGSPHPPIVPVGEAVLAGSAASPLPQALVLTAIVIGFALTCLSFVLVIAIAQHQGTTDSTALRATEPAQVCEDGKPVVLPDASKREGTS